MIMLYYTKIDRPAMNSYLDEFKTFRHLDYDFYISIYILLIYSRGILSFAWLTGYATRPVLLSDTLHTNSFNDDNNNNNNNK